MQSLAGKAALITGAARRLGRAIAETLARQGVHIVLHYHRSGSEAERLASAVRGHNVNAWVLAADLASPQEAEALVARAVEAAGPIDFLVNNAAVFPAGRLRDCSPEDLDAAIAVNAVAPFLVGRRFAAQGRPAAIVNLLDARIVDYDTEHVAYHLSKRLLFSLTRLMAIEFAPAIRVNAVAPGLILPPHGEDERYLDGLAATNPLNRHGDPDDVAAAVCFLLESDFITGQVIFVDGGRRLRGDTYGC